jgi:nuclear transport factor 2 (NTF2) superfamily protein
MHLTRDRFASWLTGYVEAWRSRDPQRIGDLFSEDCSYSYRAGHQTVVGREAIVKAWLDDEDTGSWEAAYEPLAIDQEIHVAVGETRYYDEASAVRDEYGNIFVCRFDDEGRCTEFSEWFTKLPGPVERLD